jgi:simple sugar transport system substrate-binding protein
MPDDVKTLAQETEARIKAGFDPFTGPIAKQDGSPWLSQKEVAKDKVLLGMSFFVKGIDEKLPQ